MRSARTSEWCERTSERGNGQELTSHLQPYLNHVIKINLFPMSSGARERANERRGKEGCKGEAIKRARNENAGVRSEGRGEKLSRDPEVPNKGREREGCTVV